MCFKVCNMSVCKVLIQNHIANHGQHELKILGYMVKFVKNNSYNFTIMVKYFQIVFYFQI